MSLTYAVVGPQGGSCGLEPLALDPQPDGVLHEVVGRVIILLSDLGGRRHVPL